jgi:peptidoglycan/LPS O-acetylase OafA/YrhL
LRNRAPIREYDRLILTIMRSMDEQLDNSPAQRAAESGARLRYIDALRGIAALLVLWLHVANCYRALSPETAAHVRWLNDFVSTIDIGRIGVVVFFLISGFVIPFSIRPERGAPIGSFAIRRVFRIYPAYWLSVPLAAFVFFWMVGGTFTAGQFLANLTLLQSVFGIRHAEPVYWTLVVELGFYALCIVLLLGRSLYSVRRVAILCAALAAMHLFGVFMIWLGNAVLTVGESFWMLNLSVMLWGTLYRLDKRGDRVATLAFWGLGVFYVLALPVASMLVGKPLPSYTLSYALAFAIFIVGTRFVRIETRLTDWLGRVSYSIYLFHPIVFQPIYLWLMGQPVDSAWRTQHLAVYLVANLVLTLATATLVFRFVERPMIRLGHRLAERYEQRAARSRGAATRETGRSKIAAEVAAG